MDSPDEKSGLVSFLKLDYQAACGQGWIFDFAAMNRRSAIAEANTLKSPDHETGILKARSGGFVFWCVGTRSWDCD